MESDIEKIDYGEALFGVGIVVTDIFDESFFVQGNREVLITPLHKDEKVEYDGKLEELRIICKNEGFVLALSRYYCPLTEIKDGDYYKADQDEIVLLKETKLKEEPCSAEESRRIGEKLVDIQNYLQTPITELYFLFYFKETVIVNNRGEPCVLFSYPTEYEHMERFGDHED
jgi:hypothetical protein